MCRQRPDRVREDAFSTLQRLTGIKELQSLLNHLRRFGSFPRTRGSVHDIVQQFCGVDKHDVIVTIQCFSHQFQRIKSCRRWFSIANSMALYTQGTSQFGLVGSGHGRITISSCYIHTIARARTILMAFSTLAVNQVLFYHGFWHKSTVRQHSALWYSLVSTFWSTVHVASIPFFHNNPVGELYWFTIRVSWICCVLPVGIVHYSFSCRTGVVFRNHSARYHWIQRWLYNAGHGSWKACEIKQRWFVNSTRQR